MNYVRRGRAFTHSHKKQEFEHFLSMVREAWIAVH